jgi:hypothetical protein
MSDLPVMIGNYRNRIEASRKAKSYADRTHIDVAAHELEQLLAIAEHAWGLSLGQDWNKGTAAGHHRSKLIRALGKKP